MVTREDLESFLIRMDLEYRELEEGMFLVQNRQGGPPTVLHHSEPLLLVRVKVIDVPNDRKDREMMDFFRMLLVLNATDVVHGAYGIEGGELILSDTLELETLDFPELQASLESLQLAVSSHLERIRNLAGAGAEG